MYNVKWDIEINGILLTDDDGIVPPRPVFSENINLSQYAKIHFKIPRSYNETKHIYRK